jgi:quinol monooxygenase YgiN
MNLSKSFPPFFGRPLANTVCMILLIIRMKVFSEKRKELSQAMTYLAGCIRTDKGCGRCDFCQNLEDENDLLFLEEWDTEENLKRHMQSEHFKVIRGTANLLEAPCEIVFHTVFHQEKPEKTS